MKNPQFKLYRVLYWFNHSKMGFQNSISIEAITPDQAIAKAKDDVSGCYGSKMLKRFTFKLDPSFTPKTV